MRLNVGCGSDIRDGWTNADLRAVDGADDVFDVSGEWPYDDDSAEVVEASHVLEHLRDVDPALREAARVLEPGGRLVTRWPVAMNHRSDDSHLTEWTWRTPENKLEDPWHSAGGLSLVSRTVELHPQAPRPLRSIQRRKLSWLMRLLGPGAWCWDPPGPTLGPHGGVFTVVMTA